jgi:hypothetical protein
LLFKNTFLDATLNYLEQCFLAKEVTTCSTPHSGRDPRKSSMRGPTVKRYRSDSWIVQHLSEPASSEQFSPKEAFSQQQEILEQPELWEQPSHRQLSFYDRQQLWMKLWLLLCWLYPQ